MCDLTHAYVFHDSFIRVTSLIHTCGMTYSYVWHTCDITHSYVRHDVFICVTWRIYICDMTDSCVTGHTHKLYVWQTHAHATPSPTGHLFDVTLSIRTTWFIYTCAPQKHEAEIDHVAELHDTLGVSQHTPHEEIKYGTNVLQQCVAVRCSLVRCVAVCCSVLQRDAVWCMTRWEFLEQRPAKKSSVESVC